MKKHMRNIVAALAVLTGIQNLWALDIIKDNNASDLNQPAAWVGNVVPGINDVAQWNSTVTTANTVLLGADTSWAGAKILSPGGVVQINAGNTLTLGAAGVDMSAANNNFTLNCALAIGADQSWHAGSKQFSAWGPTVNMDGHQVTILAGNKIQFKSTITGGGTLIANGGVTQLSNSTTASNTTVVVGTGATLLFDNASGPVTGIRAQNAKLNGGTLQVNANTGMNTIDYVSNALTIDSRFSVLTITSANNRNTQLRAGSCVRNPGGLALFAGLNLGLNPIASATTNSTSIWFDTPPTLLGDGGSGTTTNSVLVGVVSDITTSGTGIGMTTYDTTYGVRALNLATEYTNVITDGQSTLDNVRYSNTDAGPIATLLTAPLTVVNSLIMTENGGAGLCGIAVTSSPSSTLRINSGMIFANQSMTNTPVTSDALILQVPILDFNGNDGIVYVRETKYTSNGTCPAPFHFRSSPTNVSENGISFFAPQSAYVYLDGTQTNTYKGKVTINRNVYVRMEKPVLNNAILGPLVINGGSCQLSDHEIADDADIVMNSGSILIKTGASNSGNGGSETFRDFTMYAGTYTHAGGGGGTVVMRNVKLLGGMLNPTRGTRTTVSNDMVVAAGGRLVISSNGDSLRSGSIVYVYGEMTISNTVATTQYNPIDMGYSWYRNATALTLTNRLSVYGNSVNTNSVLVTRTYNADSKTMLAEFRLSGPVEFAIDDGAANADFEVDASMANNGAAVGSLVKTGAGTLLLTAQTNSITGGFDINEGRLLLNGIVSNDVAVASGATFGGTGLVQVASGTALTVDAGGIVAPGVSGLGTLSVTGDVSLNSASVYQVDLNGNSADALVVSGNVSGGAVLQVAKTGTGNGPWLILQANQITGTYTVQGEKLVTVTKAAGTELWLMKSQGTVISFQ